MTARWLGSLAGQWLGLQARVWSARVWSVAIWASLGRFQGLQGSMCASLGCCQNSVSPIIIGFR